MKKKTNERKPHKLHGPGKLDLTDEELNIIKTISEYLFMDQYQDTAAYPRFEECFGAFCLEQSIDLPKVFKTLCGRRRKYITFRRLISSFNQWKKNTIKYNEDTSKFIELVFKNLLKNPKENVGKIVDKAICYNTNNSEFKKAISQFCVITDEDQNIIKGFQITYDDFFKNNLFLNKENEKFYVSLELNLASDNPTTETAQESFPDVNYRDGITHLGGTIKDGNINFLVFKCRSGKTSFVGKPSGQPFLFGCYGKQLHLIKIAVKNGSLIYMQPEFIDVERHNPKIDKTSEEITEHFLKQDKPIYEETILENVTNEEEVEKNILAPIMKDDRFYDKLKHTDRITGRPFFQIYPNVNKFIRFDPMSGRINVHINPLDVVSEAANFIANRRQILSQVKNVLQPKNFLSGIGSLLLARTENSMSPGEVLQNPISLTNFIGDMVHSVQKSAKEEGKKGIVKGILSGAVSGLSGLFAGNRGQFQDDLPPYPNAPEDPNQINYPNYPNYPGVPNDQNMNMGQQYPMQIPPMLDNNMNDINNNYNVEFYQPNDENQVPDQEYSSAKLRAGKNKTKAKSNTNKNKTVLNNNPDKLKATLPFGFNDSGIGNVLNVMNNVAQNFFGFGGNRGGISSMFNPFGFSGNSMNYYYYDDYEEKEQEERRRQAEQIQRQHEEEMRKKMNEEIIKKKTQIAQKNWRHYYDKYSKDQGIFLIQTIGAVIRGLTIIKNERMGIKTNYTYEEKEKI